MIFFLSVISIIVILIILGIVKMEVVGGIIIGILSAQVFPAYKYFFRNDKEESPKNISMPYKKPEFSAEIVNKKKYYIRGIDTINFRSAYKGKLQNGYFANELSFQIKFKVEPKDIFKFVFKPNIPNVSADGLSVKSFCLETIDNTNDRIGNLNGNRHYKWKQWKWEIPNDAPLGEYKVKMMVFNGGKDNPPLQVIEDEINISQPPAVWDDVNFENLLT